MKQFSISRYLMAGQLYIVNVIAHVDITYVLARSAVHSMDATVRLGMIFQNSIFQLEINTLKNSLALCVLFCLKFTL